ncbi:MAG: hypothetical protein K2P95_05535 [Hyphomonadaceae bacterium]|nr:hypothetical protein [Hyphomonadaceae bacterium]
MSAGQRARERIFTIAMWVVSVVFAGFLIGLGSLIIADLPTVESRVSLQQFVDRPAEQRIEAEERALSARLQTLEQAEADAQGKADAARAQYQTAKDSFDAWIATRTATGDASQDPEVLNRQRRLDQLGAGLRAAEEARQGIGNERAAAQMQQAQLQTQRDRLLDAAVPRYRSAKFWQDAKVFAWRLLLTLPLLVLAFHFAAQKRKGDYWPLKRGFILFAGFTFFVELAPYLPDYGWYVRSLVGIGLTIVASHFAIRWMRTYLASREMEERKAEVERKRAIQYDEALRKMAARTCPSCDRPVATTDDAPTDYCVHCGLRLFDHCGTCTTRKFVFFRYCMKCGAATGSRDQSAPA